jgi:carbon dioxide concentrating mechanism protein CcmN
MPHNSYASNSTVNYAAVGYTEANRSVSYVPPLQPPVNLPMANAQGNVSGNLPLEAQVYGEVIIDPSAVLGLGVMIRAEVGAKIVIGAGVCVGMGTVLHAQGGDILVGNGVSIGAGGLILGTAKLGDNSCLGTSTTVINSIVPSGAVVSPGTVVNQGLGSVNSGEVEPTNDVNPEVFATESVAPEITSKQNFGIQEMIRETVEEKLEETVSETFVLENFTTENFTVENFTATTTSSTSEQRLESAVSPDIGTAMVTENFTQTEFIQTQTTQIQPNQTISESVVGNNNSSNSFSGAPTASAVTEANHQITAPEPPQPVNAFPIDAEKAKAHAQSQLNRFRNRLFPNSHNPSSF